MRFKPRFSDILHIFLVDGTLRLSFGRSRKVYVLTAVNTVPSRSSRYIYGFLATAQNHSLNRIGLSVKEDYGHQPDQSKLQDHDGRGATVSHCVPDCSPPYAGTILYCLVAKASVCVCVCVCAFLCV